MVYVGGGGRLEAVSILELKTSISAFCNKPELKIRAQHSKCTYISKYYSLGTLFHCSYFYYNTWVDIRMSKNFKIQRGVCGKINIFAFLMGSISGSSHQLFVPFFANQTTIIITKVGAKLRKYVLILKT